MTPATTLFSPCSFSDQEAEALGAAVGTVTKAQLPNVVCTVRMLLPTFRTMDSETDT